MTTLAQADAYLRSVGIDPATIRAAKPGPYQPGSTGETDESGRMVWRFADDPTKCPECGTTLDADGECDQSDLPPGLPDFDTVETANLDGTLREKQGSGPHGTYTWEDVARHLLAQRNATGLRVIERHPNGSVNVALNLTYTAGSDALARSIADDVADELVCLAGTAHVPAVPAA